VGGRVGVVREFATDMTDGQKFVAEWLLVSDASLTLRRGGANSRELAPPEVRGGRMLAPMSGKAVLLLTGAGGVNSRKCSLQGMLIY
jgi:hypothetical protein